MKIDDRFDESSQPGKNKSYDQYSAQTGCVKTYQWLKLFLRHKFKFGDEIVKMLITRVDMSLCSNGYQTVEMMYIHMDKHSK